MQQQFVVHGGIVNFAAEAFEQKAGCAAGDIDVFADQIGVDACDEIIEVQVQIFHAGVEFGREVVAQPFRIHAGLDVGVGGDERAARFTHFRAVHGQKAVGEYVSWRAVTREFQGCRPKQRVEIEDVFANEMVLLGGRIGLGPFVEIQSFFRAQVFETGVVADRRIEPDVEIFARRVWNFKAEIRRVARNIPVREFVLVTFAEPFAHFIGRFGLRQTLHPVA